MSIKSSIVYFEEPGKQNTETSLKLARKYADARGITDIVVASTTGDTGVKASKLFKDLNLVVVTHHVGFTQAGVSQLKEENRKEILANGAKILTATHALSSAERAIRKKFGTIMPLEIMAHVLRLFGEGTKVCVEIVMMAADAGLISVNKEVIAIGGTGGGADTVLLLEPVNSSNLFDLKIKEVIAKPRNWKRT